MELFAPRRVTEMLGMEGSETLVRAFGTREIVAGITSLSVDKNAGLWARVGGDGLDAAALLSGLRPDNPKKGNIALALLMVGGIAMLLPGRAGHQAATSRAQRTAQALSEPQWLSQRAGERQERREAARLESHGRTIPGSGTDRNRRGKPGQ
ncbi:hypothetical protein [Bradyrhizobium sp. S3.9.1]|uniref:hypothetical protein n=1 Tax=Bradyrhizobium sp. S3.9.1 TaxID=3156431 RepID=UPI00339777F9